MPVQSGTCRTKNAFYLQLQRHAIVSWSRGGASGADICGHPYPFTQSSVELMNSGLSQQAGIVVEGPLVPTLVANHIRLLKAVWS